MTATTLDSSTGPVAVTPAAIKFMQRMVRFGSAGMGGSFRLEVSPGGCSGLASQFTIESAPKPEDHVLTMEGLTVYMPPQSFELLSGVTIDFAETAMDGGLKFLDPKGAACACGTGVPSFVQLSKRV